LWHKVGTLTPSYPSRKYGNKIRVWAGISKKGKSEIYFHNKKFNSKSYLECLESSLIPVASQLYPDGNWKLLQDNDGPHVAKSTLTRLQGVWGIEILSHTPNSPDLNPIEKIWSVLDARVQAMIPSGIGELKRCILLAWQNLSQDTIDNTIDSLKSIIPKILVSDGEFVDFQLYHRYNRRK